MKLDFVMKLFLALIVVFFIIIAVYYTANGLANVFGVNFKIQKPGAYSGNLGLLGIKNVSKIRIGNATYSDCLSYCKRDPFEPHMLGNCEDQCAFICNQTGKCINVTGKFRIATLSSSADFLIVLEVYTTNGKQDITIDSETFNDLPEVTYITHTFFLPNGSSDKGEDTFIQWRTGGAQGKIYIGKTKAIKLLREGESCGGAYSCCSVFKENTTVKKGELNQSANSNKFKDIENCKSILMDLKSNCTFPLYVTESESGTVMDTFRFDRNGTYSIDCPITTESITLSADLENCFIKYNLTISSGLVKDTDIKCYNQSTTITDENNNQKTIYFCNCSESGLNTCGPTCS